MICMWTVEALKGRKIPKLSFFFFFSVGEPLVDCPTKKYPLIDMIVLLKT